MRAPVRARSTQPVLTAASAAPGCGRHVCRDAERARHHGTRRMRSAPATCATVVTAASATGSTKRAAPASTNSRHGGMARGAPATRRAEGLLRVQQRGRIACSRAGSLVEWRLQHASLASSFQCVCSVGVRVHCCAAAAFARVAVAAVLPCQRAPTRQAHASARSCWRCVPPRVLTSVPGA